MTYNSQIRLVFPNLTILHFQAQSWGQGKKRARDPKFLIDSIPAASKFRDFDPRPPELRQTSQKELNEFLIECQTFSYESNWDTVPILYDDFELSNERKLEIVAESKRFIFEMRSELEKKYSQDPLTNCVGYHVTGTYGNFDSVLYKISTRK